jgi:molybdenum ABC transporter molybdate-binding protein
LDSRVAGKCRRGRARSALIVLLGSSVLITALVGALYLLGRQRGTVEGKTLRMYCAAGLRAPVEQAVRQYSHEYGVTVQVQYGGSNTLLSQIEASRTGDLYLAADDYYLLTARQKGLAVELFGIALMRPVIAVPKGNPKKVKGIRDLIERRLRVALANPDQAAVGREVRESLKRRGLWQPLAELARRSGVFKPTVNELANDVLIGAVDAGIVWDALLPQYPELEAIECPEFKNATASVGLAVLSSAKDPRAAIHFARYLTARDRGLGFFAKLGYKVVEGDAWAEVPEIVFFVGSVNRRAIEDTIKEFQKREGVVVNTVYHGCGILTAQMRSIRQQGGTGFPDAYMACDVYYLNNVRDWFQEAVNVSETEIVMVVQKGNPKGIKSLADLTRPGIRVVVGQPDQCTIGALTRRLLQQEGIYAAVMKNVVSQTASSAMLVPAITTGSADVALAYATDARAEAERVDAVRIDSPYTKAIQPFAIAKMSKHKNLVRRLFDAIVRNSRRFELAGFHFRLQMGPYGYCTCLLPTGDDSLKGARQAQADSEQTAAE